MTPPQAREAPHRPGAETGLPIRETGEVPRVLGDLGSPAEGPTLLVVAGLHGNEPAGVFALHSLLAQLQEQETDLKGRFVALAGNRRALAAGRRYLDQDLNRAWPRAAETSARGEKIRREAAEAAELDELRRIIDGLLDEATGPVFCLDLHTTSGPGPAFSVLNDTLPNRRFARAFPVPVVLGLEEELAGTLAGHLSDLGVCVIGFESGRHQDTTSIDRAEDAIWIALGAAGLFEKTHEEISRAYDRLAGESDGLPGLVEVRYRHAITAGDGFRIEDGLGGFQPVVAGARIGEDKGGPVLAPHPGLLLMPLYQEQGNDGYFITRQVSPAWMPLSTALRRLGAERIVHWLPGVKRHPDLACTYVVDRKLARWLALDIFHLLGFRRMEEGERYLTMTRRLSDA